ncbi:hypothetical protein HPB50_005137 [Hyalomma asiaticum]|uniref:Uncharacterized protein n=1 Tax=Hyalomma asiaticum TaxID=266040 RepID=A0ACB7RNB2_HYAAI|nr:hypothetical protein HPB50_005137 [Hyalomma asiaticum]
MSLVALLSESVNPRAVERSGNEEEYSEQDQLLEEILTVAKENGYKLRILKKAPLGPDSRSTSTVNKSTSLAWLKYSSWIGLATAVFMIPSRWSYVVALTARHVRVAKSASDGVHVSLEAAVRLAACFKAAKERHFRSQMSTLDQKSVKYGDKLGCPRKNHRSASSCRQPLPHEAGEDSAIPEIGTQSAAEANSSVANLLRHIGGPFDEG